MDIVVVVVYMLRTMSA